MDGLFYSISHAEVGPGAPHGPAEPTLCYAALTTSISVLECPMLQTMQLFFIRSRCSLVTTFLLPVRRECRNISRHKNTNYVCDSAHFLPFPLELGARLPTPAPRTCAGDDNVHLSDDFVELHEPEPIHAEREKKTGRGKSNNKCAKKQRKKKPLIKNSF